MTQANQFPFNSSVSVLFQNNVQLGLLFPGFDGCIHKNSDVFQGLIVNLNNLHPLDPPCTIYSPPLRASQASYFSSSYFCPLWRHHGEQEPLKRRGSAKPCVSSLFLLAEAKAVQIYREMWMSYIWTQENMFSVFTEGEKSYYRFRHLTCGVEWPKTIHLIFYGAKLPASLFKCHNIFTHLPAVHPASFTLDLGHPGADQSQWWPGGRQEATLDGSPARHRTHTNQSPLCHQCFVLLGFF